MVPILLLHGAIGSKVQMEPLARELARQFDVHQIDFSGHGANTLYNDDFSISLFALDVLRYLEENKLDRIAVFGYSMGGFIGMYLARHHPEKLTHLVTLATKFEWTPEVAAREIKMLDPDVIRAKVPAFARQLEQQHGADQWAEVLAKTRRLMITLGENNPLSMQDYSAITVPCLLLLGDRDKMVSREETRGTQQKITGAQLEILPATSHPLEQTDPVLLSHMIRQFLIP